MEFVPAVYTKMTAALQETLTQTVETFTDFMSDVAIIVWLIDRPRRNLVVKSQLNAGEGLENQFKLAIDVKDFVVQAFKEQKSQYGDNLIKVIAPPIKRIRQRAKLEIRFCCSTANIQRLLWRFERVSNWAAGHKQQRESADRIGSAAGDRRPAKPTEV